MVSNQNSWSKAMPDPVNLAILREAIGDDRQLKKQILIAYLESADESIYQLQKSFRTDDAKLWRYASHSLKGSSVNIGANNLGDLCLKAQNSQDDAREKKQHILADILSEYELVSNYLNQVINSY